MNTFNDIITWITTHKDSIIIAIVVELVLIGFAKTWVLTKKIPKAIKRLGNIKAIKYLEFILLYALPLGTIVWMIVDSTNEPTFKYIALFIIICITFIFNILMNHIISIYRMIRKLTDKASNNDLVQKEAINKLFEAVGKEERIE